MITDRVVPVPPAVVNKREDGFASEEVPLMREHGVLHVVRRAAVTSFSLVLLSSSLKKKQPLMV